MPASIDRELHEYIASYCGIKTSDILDYAITRRSIDARKQPDVKLVYSLTADLKDSARPKRSLEPAAPDMPFDMPSFSYANPPLHPVIVGAGPAGLFCALILAMAGCKPVILDRGRDVGRRKNDIDRFLQTVN